MLPARTSPHWTSIQVAALNRDGWVCRAIEAPNAPTCGAPAELVMRIRADKPSTLDNLAAICSRHAGPAPIDRAAEARRLAYNHHARW